NVRYKPRISTRSVQKPESVHPTFELWAQGGLAMAHHTRAANMFGSEPCFQVLGVRVNALQIPDVIARMEEWIHDRKGCHSVAATSMHGIVEAQHDPSFKELLNTTDLVVPDGMPLVWLGPTVASV